MPRFVDRKQELRELDSLLDEERGRMAAVYGRRRVGKTTLLLRWAQASSRPHIYWMARHETPDTAREGLATSLWRWAYDEEDPMPPRFQLWERLFREMARMIGEQPAIVIFDEFPYAVSTDRSLPSHLQWAWDHVFKELPITLILAGSHIGMMVDLLEYDAPLYGRITAQLRLDPLPYEALSEFFPKYTAVERVSTYAVLGGIPAYWEEFDPEVPLNENVRRHLFRRVGLFQSEPRVLLADLIREPGYYESVLRSVTKGNRTPSDVGDDLGLASSNVSPYLKRLCELQLMERRTPATLPPKQRRTTTQSRYELRDPFLRFYYRFVEPHTELIEQGKVDLIWRRIREQFRSFVGMHTFEELSREWVWEYAGTDAIPFLPETVGQHWSTTEQIDVVAINWREKAILLGECKWGADTVGRKVIRKLLQKSKQVIPDSDWEVHYAFFAREGFTDAAQREAETVDALLIDLAQLDADLRRRS